MALGREMSTPQWNMAQFTFTYHHPEGFPLEFGNEVWNQEARMMGLPDGERSSMISLAVGLQCTSVRDRRTDRQTDRQTLADSYA